MTRRAFLLKTRPLTLCLLFSLSALAAPPARLPPPKKAYMNEQPTRARHAIVVSVHHLAADAGVEVMRMGGNAVDAAVATGFALAVVLPWPATSVVGDSCSFTSTAQSARQTNTPGRPSSSTIGRRPPLAATADMYLDAQGKVLPDASTIGYKAIGVPGSAAGMVYAEKTYGKLDLKRVMAPAIKLAADGFALTAPEAEELHDEDLGRFPESKRIFQRDGNFYKAGEVFRQPELGETLRKIAADPDDFYHGAMAAQIQRRRAKEWRSCHCERHGLLPRKRA